MDTLKGAKIMSNIPCLETTFTNESEVYKFMKKIDLLALAVVVNVMLIKVKVLSISIIIAF